MEAARRPAGRLSRRRPPRGSPRARLLTPHPCRAGSPRARLLTPHPCRAGSPRARLLTPHPCRAGSPPRPASPGAESGPWAALLRAAGAGPSPDCEPLPALPDQEPEPGPDGPAPPEVFTVGSKTFFWTPFPPAPGAAGEAARPRESPSGPREGRPAPDPCGAPGAPEPPPGPPALQSCPMCGKAFAPRLDQLDVDSHLAQCLAEGAEDVAW
ncbi:Fanconi anemia core complex-associated protein 20 [Perognathus longimembris pacificus]|uniref:Fanconi anemia core complex-associated protein 20 n=1 Tax=Perognathus longimembris pacificus TaxID=214514 RepID=UPI002018D4AF|nr:Fanconi anemia core complex-associated protein 20 [Perognathus longimembris pacificus]